jgi:flagellar hook-length control protein FliK
MAAQSSEGGHTLEIQFNAKTLDGLRVHLQSQQGAISVNLQTAVPDVARLLTNNLSSLRGALERKGATVANLIVDRRHG